LRMRNEKANFDAYYQHSLFQEVEATPVPRPRATVATRLKRSWSALAGRRPASPPEVTQTPAPAVVAAAPVSAFTYSHNLLLERLALTPPAFGVRLAARAAARSSDGPIRILSLCSGEARIEAGLVRHLPAGSASLTLLDMNPDLLNRATQRLAQSCAVEGVLADVNELDLRGRKFDVILCVSGLHHVVELEHVFEEVSAALEDDGEFWSIGETLGRNGGRMWPESYEVANAFFRRLPQKYRVNRTTGNVVDEDLGDMDYSIGCFEGIRCESIEPVLDRYLTPVDVCRHNCTLFKLFSPTYSDNYDTRSADDRALIEQAVDREIALFRRGGRPVELNGVYRRRQGSAG
jgi:SAM-dependent methyltransferase